MEGRYLLLGSRYPLIYVCCDTSTFSANDNFLTLNASKCEIVVFEKFVGKTHRNIDVDFPMKNEGKCLGYTWSSNPCR